MYTQLDSYPHHCAKNNDFSKTCYFRAICPTPPPPPGRRMGLYVISISINLVPSLSSWILVCTWWKLLGDVGTSCFFFNFDLAHILFFSDFNTGAGWATIAILDFEGRLVAAISGFEGEERFEAAWDETLGSMIIGSDILLNTCENIHGVVLKAGVVIVEKETR